MSCNGGMNIANSKLLGIIEAPSRFCDSPTPPAPFPCAFAFPLPRAVPFPSPRAAGPLAATSSFLALMNSLTRAWPSLPVLRRSVATRSRGTWMTAAKTSTTFWRGTAWRRATSSNGKTSSAVSATSTIRLGGGLRFGITTDVAVETLSGCALALGGWEVASCVFGAAHSFAVGLLQAVGFFFGTPWATGPGCAVTLVMGALDGVGGMG